MKLPELGGGNALEVWAEEGENVSDSCMLATGLKKFFSAGSARLFPALHDPHDATLGISNHDPLPDDF